MSTQQPTPERDPEFRPLVNWSSAADHSQALEEYQRIVANPFLGLLAIVLWLVGLRLAFSPWHATRSVPLLICLVACAIWLPFMFHYHCRDCGSSGPLHRWRRHVCPAIAERSRTGRRRRLRGPTPPVQVVLWLYALLAFAILASSLGVSLGPVIQ